MLASLALDVDLDIVLDVALDAELDVDAVVVEASNSTASSIVKNIVIGCTPTQNPSQLTTDGDNLYYEYQGNVYKIDKAATVAPASPFITAPATSL